jgi:cytoskeletal protein RodZ
MKRNLACWAIALGLMLSVAGLAMAQDSTTTQQQTTTTTTTTNDNSATPAQSTDTMSTPSAAQDTTASPSATQSTTQDNTQTTAPSSTMSDKDSAMTPSSNGTATSDKSSDVRTVTGCLRAGDNSKEYELRGSDGSSWELKSDAVDMASHVGHTVTVTGAIRNADMHGMKEDAKKAGAEHGMGSGNEHGHMTVTDLKMVSESCTR